MKTQRAGGQAPDPLRGSPNNDAFAARRQLIASFHGRIGGGSRREMQVEGLRCRCDADAECRGPREMQLAMQFAGLGAVAWWPRGLMVS